MVGVHSDETTSLYKRSPYIPQEQRYEMVKSCRYVDEVIEDAPTEITEEFLRKYNIDLVIHGDDVGNHFKKQHAVPLQQGKMKYISYTSGVSTSEIIERIRRRK
jgi:ethanolamine-phosphate cytidylyltransferase